MKNNYFILLLFLVANSLFSQNTYEFGIVQISGYDFKIVAIPNFDSSGDTDVSDLGVTLMLPAGNTDVTTISNVLAGKTPTINQVDATTLDGLSLGDGTRDLFSIVLSATPSGIFSHTNGVQIDLFSFTVSNTPLNGEISILDNSDPIAIGLGGAVDNFYEANLGSGTGPRYSGIATGLESFNFSTLSTENVQLSTNLSVYPNPTLNYLTIKTTASVKNVAFYNTTGKLILETTEIQSIPTSKLTKGIYFLKIETDLGHVIKKIVKK